MIRLAPLYAADYRYAAGLASSPGMTVSPCTAVAGGSTPSRP